MVEVWRNNEKKKNSPGFESAPNNIYAVNSALHCFVMSSVFEMFKSMVKSVMKAEGSKYVLIMVCWLSTNNFFSLKQLCQ